MTRRHIIAKRAKGAKIAKRANITKRTLYST